MTHLTLAPSFLLSLLAALPLALPAAAQDDPPDAAACAEQWRAVCGDAEAPTERVACLQTHRGRFTRDCIRQQRQEIGKARRALGAVHRECKAERTERCADAGGIVEVAACLDDARESLEGACARSVDAYRAALAELD